MDGSTIFERGVTSYWKRTFWYPRFSVRSGSTNKVMGSSDVMQCSLLAPVTVTMVFKLLSFRIYCVGDFVVIALSLSSETLIIACPVSMTKHNRNAFVRVGENSSLRAPTGLYHVIEPS